VVSALRANRPEVADRAPAVDTICPRAWWSTP